MANAKFFGIIALVLVALAIVGMRFVEINNQPTRYKWADKRGQYCTVIDKANVSTACDSYTKDQLNAMRLEYDRPPAN